LLLDCLKLLELLGDVDFRLDIELDLVTGVKGFDIGNLGLDEDLETLLLLATDIFELLDPELWTLFEELTVKVVELVADFGIESGFSFIVAVFISLWSVELEYFLTTFPLVCDEVLLV